MGTLGGHKRSLYKVWEFMGTYRSHKGSGDPTGHKDRLYEGMRSLGRAKRDFFLMNHYFFTKTVKLF